jgi:hypothetical protein
MSETVVNPISNLNETVSKNSETFFARDVGISEAASITGRSKGQNRKRFKQWKTSLYSQ